MKKDTISYIPWGSYEGKNVYLFKLKNINGAFVELINYGATIVSIVVPDKRGKLENVVLGFPSFEEYVNDQCYIGSTIGRFANRIGGARFTLDGVTYHLEKNDNANTNHGGVNGFNSRVFDFIINAESLSFTLTSKDREGGYPGNLQFKVTYSWNDNNELAIRYEAVSDKKTVLNFTNHAYFNLSSEQGDMLDHELTIHAGAMLVTDRDYIPNGLIVPLNDNSFNQRVIRESLTISDSKVTGSNNYYILDRKDKNKNSHACTLIERISGRMLEIFTTYPGVQFYTGDYLGVNSLSDQSKKFKPFDGLCLECQHYPDSPNHSNFPSTTIDAGEVYDECIVFKFGTIP